MAGQVSCPSFPFLFTILFYSILFFSFFFFFFFGFLKSRDSHIIIGSILEFHKIIRQLTHPQDAKTAFHVVVPSLPGYGFSEAPKKKGCDPIDMAKTFDALMVALGFKTYYAQGGDWGAIISKALGIVAPQRCLAIHISMPIAPPPKPFPNLLNLPYLLLVAAAPSLVLSKEEHEGLKRTIQFNLKGTGYQLEQSTKPQTLSYGLNDSPVGLLAWILEKFYEWSDCKGNIESRFTKDELLTNVMVGNLVCVHT